MVAKNIIFGNYGPGSYYYYIMVQFVFFIPIIKQIIKVYEEKGLLILFIINLVYEFICKIIRLNVVYYRLLAFRYVFIIGIGVYIFWTSKIVKKKIPNYILFIGIGIGTVFLSLSYTGYNYKLFSYPVWWRTSMLVGCYVGAVCYFIIEKFSGYTINGFIGEWISKIGESTYHILYVQMLFYVVYYDIGKEYFSIGVSGKLCFIVAIFFMNVVGVVWSKFECKFKRWVKDF